jgi:O-acetylhomoserine (thiol)-lyase
MTDKTYRQATLCVHAGATPDPVTRARTVPIYQTAAYVFKDSRQAKNLFALKETGNIYTRLNNPTTAVFEERVAAIEGGVGSLATASGMAAISTAILSFTALGDEILSGDKLYGGTHELFSQTFPSLSSPSETPGWTSRTLIDSPKSPTKTGYPSSSTTPWVSA